MNIEHYTYNHYLDGDVGILDAHVHIGKIPYSKEFSDAVNEGEIKALSFGLLPSQYLLYTTLQGCNVVCGLGFHPWEVLPDNKNELNVFDDSFEAAKLIGEIGLDFSEKRNKFKENQLEVFRHIAKLLGKSNGKIISIHAFNSVDIIMDIFENYGVFDREHSVVFHWFNGSSQQLEKAIRRHCYFSVGPKMLSTKKGYQIIQQIPEDKMLIETDLPWDNEPLIYSDYVNIVNDFLMELRELKLL